MIAVRMQNLSTSPFGYIPKEYSWFFVYLNHTDIDSDNNATVPTYLQLNRFLQNATVLHRHIIRIKMAERVGVKCQDEEWEPIEIT